MNKSKKGIVDKLGFQKTIPIFLSRRIANRIWKNQIGNLPENHKSDLEGIIKKTRLMKLLYDTEKRLSLTGRRVVMVQMEDGEIKYSYGDVLTYQIAFGEYIFIQVLHEFSFGTRFYQIAETWTKTHVTRKITYIDKEEDVKPAKSHEIDIQYFNELTGLKLTHEWNHNLGFIPAVVFTNFDNFEGLAEPDMELSGHLLPVLDDHFNTLRWELNINKTRVFVTKGSSPIKTAKSAQSYYEKLRDEVIVETQGVTKDSFEYVQGNLQQSLSSVWTSFYDTFNTILILSGYMEPSFNNVGTVQQNNGEIAGERITEIDTVLTKVKAREGSLNELFFITMRVLGKSAERDEFDIQITPDLSKYVSITDALVPSTDLPPSGTEPLETEEVDKNGEPRMSDPAS